MDDRHSDPISSRILLKDHQLFGIPTLPAVVMIEMALLSAERFLKRPVRHLQNVTFIRPVTQHHSEKLKARVKVTHNAHGGLTVVLLAPASTFREYSDTDDERNWLECASGHLIDKENLAFQQSNPTLAVERLTGMQLDPSRLYDWFSSRGLAYGATFRCIKNLWVSDNTVVAELSAVDGRSSAQPKVELLDGALQAVAALAVISSDAPDCLYIPNAIGSFTQCRSYGSHAWATVCVDATTWIPENGFAADVTITDNEGNVAAKFNKVQWRRLSSNRPNRIMQPSLTGTVSPSKNLAVGSQELAIVTWTEKSVDGTYASPENHTSRILFDDGRRLGKELFNRLKPISPRVIRVFRGKYFRILDNNIFEINPDETTDYQLLLHHLATLLSGPAQIIHLWSSSRIERLEPALEELQAQLRNGIYSVFSIVRQVLNGSGGFVNDLRVITPNSQGAIATPQVTHPEHATIAPMLRTLLLEQTRVKTQTIDLAYDEEAPEMDQLLRLICDELCSAVKDPEIILTNAKRMIPSIRPANLLTPTKSAIRQNGVYLISGGLGGIGLQVARWLSEGYRAKLILVSRTPITRHQDSTTNAKLTLLQNICTRSQVMIANLDISDEESVERLLSSAKQRFGAVHGVFHAAGVLRDRLLLNMSVDDLNAVFRSKVFGTTALDSALKNEPLDFSILFSSLVGLGGNIGQANYAAANRFLDSFAVAQSRQGRKIISVDWAPWNGTGMAEALRDKMYRGIRPLPVSTALALLEFAADCKVPQLAAGLPASALSVPLPSVISPPQSRRADQDEICKQQKHSVIELQNVLLRQVASVLQIPVAEIKAQDRFPDLGVDSIMAVELARGFETVVGRPIPLARLFEADTVESLVHLLQSELTPNELLTILKSRPAVHEVTETDVTDTVLRHDSSEKREQTTSIEMDMHDFVAEYQKNVRPAVAERLHAINLAKTYVRAEGDRMYYNDGSELKEVIDFVGGYGATLFGHNHVELCSYASMLYSERLPIHAQISIHPSAAQLAAQLSIRLKQSTGKEFITTVLTTGSEAVEAAIVHSLFEYEARLRRFERDVNRSFTLLVRRLGSDSVVDESLKRMCVAQFGSKVRSLEDVQRLILAHNEATHKSELFLLCLERAFHGRTLGAASVSSSSEEQLHSYARRNILKPLRIDPEKADLVLPTDADLVKTVFELSCDEHKHIRVVKRSLSNIVAAIVEPVQGEGGVHVLNSGFVAQLRSLADTHDFPVIVDEIQSGLGRCGNFTAASLLGLIGDYYLFGKSLGGGLAKISTVSVARSRYQSRFGLYYTSTFAEDEFSSSIALKALSLIERDEIPQRCERAGDLILAGLRDLHLLFPDIIRDVRGSACMIGVELADQSSSRSAVIRMTSHELGYIVASYLLNEEGIRIFPAGSAPRTLRLEPSAYISEADVAECLGALERLCVIIRHANAGRLLRHLVGLHDRVKTSPITDWRELHPEFGVAPQEDDSRVAFLMHLTDATELEFFDPSLQEIGGDGLQEIVQRFCRVLKPRVVKQYRIKSRLGTWTHLSVLGFVCTSNLIEQAIGSGDSEWLDVQIADALDLAKTLGCSAVGLGGHLSIATSSCQNIARSDLVITSGNALTAGMVFRAVKDACRQKGIDLNSSQVGIIGANGNIGSVLCELIAREAESITLVGRKGSEPILRRSAEKILANAWTRGLGAKSEDLSGISRVIAQASAAGRLSENGRFDAGEVGHVLLSELGSEFDEERKRPPVRWGDNLEMVASCNVVICVTSATQAVLSAEHIGRSPAIICDVAWPQNVSQLIGEAKRDVFVFRGGVLRLPDLSDKRICGRSLSEGKVYACLGETLLMGWSGIKESLSLGPINPSDVEKILELADQYGFEAELLPMTGCDELISV